MNDSCNKLTKFQVKSIHNELDVKNKKQNCLNKNKILLNGIQMLIGMMLLCIGIIYPFNENHSIPNAKIIEGTLIDTQISPYYTQEEIIHLRPTELKKHGIYKFEIDGNVYKVKDTQLGTKIRKTRKIIYNKSDASQCMVKMSYIKLLPFTIIGFFLIFCVIFPRKTDEILDKIFMKKE